MNTEKRTLLALFLSGLILLVWSIYQTKKHPPEPPPVLVKEGKETLRVHVDTTKIAPPPADTIITNITKNIVFPLGEGENIIVDTEVYRAIFNTKGACLKSFILKNYKNKHGKEGVELIPDGRNALSLSLLIGSDTIDLSSSIFIPSNDSISLKGENKTFEISFITTSKDSFSVTKKFLFESSRPSFFMNVNFQSPARVSSAIKYRVSWDAGLMVTEKNEKEDLSYFSTFGLLGDHINSDNLGDFKKEPTITYTGKIYWTGVRSKYFMACLVPPPERAQEIVSKKIAENILSTSLWLQIPEKEDRFLIYAGPISYNILKSYHLSLERMTESGTGWTSWFLPLERLFLKIFLFLHSIIHNWGLVIMLFACLIEIVLFPFSYQSLKSAKEMQKLGPKMTQIRNQYKDDPTTMNREIMLLYRKHKVNPFGGCLPMLFQLPVFITLYNLLKGTFELRGAKFFLWITDLSQPDRFFILPILMGVSQFFQSLVSGATSDPRQKQMMYLMPIIMTVMFILYNFPAGLTLYWLTKNLLSIAESYFMRIQSKRKESSAD